MGVDLGRIGRPARCQPKALDRPAQVVGVFGRAQGQALAQSRLIQLDHRNAGRLQVGDLVAQRQGKLLAGPLARLVVSHERPHQDGHRSGEHSLDRTLGERLGVLGPAGRHRFGAPYITVNQRRPHAASAVALDPSVAGEYDSFELLAKVFDHVGAFKFAVHQHVDVQVFLDSDGAGDLGAQEFFVLGQSLATAAVSLPLAPDLGGLRE